MYTKYAEILSLLLIVAYCYKKTKNKTALWVIGSVFICVILLVFRIPFISDVLQYGIFLIVFFVSLIIIAIKGYKEQESKDKEKIETKKEEGKKDISAILKFSKDNIIFWTII